MPPATQPRLPRPVAAVGSAAVVAMLAAGLVSATGGGARADLTLPLPSGTVTVPVPTVAVPTVAVPTVAVPTATASPSLSAAPSPTGGRTGEGATSSGAGSAGGAGATGSPGRAAGASRAAAATPAGRRAGTAALTRAEQRRRDATPMVAGTDAAQVLLDDEASPALRLAGTRFLAADQAIAAIAGQQRRLAQLRQDAARTRALWRAMGFDVAGAQATADAWRSRLAGLPRDTSGTQRRRVQDAATRAGERLGDLVVARDVVRADYGRLAARYAQTRQALAGTRARVSVLAAARRAALSALRAAKGGDVALNQARLAESGSLGAQIDALSTQLAQRGDTVPGTGDPVAPLAGTVTSPFGMRFHPILRYPKLHTGTDIAGGPVIRAPDDGRVLMTVVSEAYGNYTVIDHGVVNGRRLTTAYAHQASFLVKPGQVVRKGDPIGIVGQTGWVTGPHLHFEVRRNGAVVDPLAFLATR